MRASSQATYAAAEERWEPLLRESGAAALGYGEQLFGVVDLLESSGGLRRSLTDPTRSGEDKAALAGRLLEGKVDPVVVDLLAGLARGRWSDEADLGEAVARLGVTSVLAAAQNADRLDAVQDELFGVERLLDGDDRLRRALLDREAAPARRAALVDDLLQGRVGPETLLLVRRVAERADTRYPGQELRSIAERAAARRERLVATVSAAVPLNQQQVQRLGALLERAYGRPVQVNVGVDPEVLGGMRVQVGDEVIDGTVLARVEEARRRMAG